MKIKSVIASITLTLLTGYLFAQRYQLKSPDKVLTGIKQLYHDVEASYINYHPENYKKLGLETLIYKGGISTPEGSYEFIANAYTGELLDTKEM
ncbi:hypothetical protein ERX37_00800 [Macrococcus hajekii]|uniref:PepSY domain-containing protein n=1 Tax=Macrococcus hajekii TaxID=198482 RepID=A0A4R6BLS7_9STAP|nr:hypothetical protein [Macrococcus hajekii]TDM02658.1 hypothetical protein ERX37_00800 [Macrococcus hajekii]GGB02821.1 hypothetical protein GCM10007190_08530 [Macrococcus hajekii]